jgi:hypothetical protein
MTARCAQESNECVGDVKEFSFDLDLPTVALCGWHVMDLLLRAAGSSGKAVIGDV